MEMHQVRYFLAVAQELNFSRAAEKCNVSQPSLSRAIQQLEGELGGPLFHRERHLTHLTDLGEMVREQVLLALPLRRLCREECRGLCPSCGVNRNADSCDCHPAETVDERLAVLRKLFDKGSS